MKVLVVDDVRTNRMLASRILEKRGHTVKTAGSGSEAIEVLALEDFDLVLMDIQMPKMSGIETAAFIRNSISDVRRREIAILATSARSEHDQRLHEGRHKRIYCKADKSRRVNRPD